MNEQKLAGLLGLARRSGQVAIGAEKALDSVRRRRANLVLLDETASDNTRKKVLDACAFYDVRSAVVPEGMLEKACGLNVCKAAALMKGCLSDEIIRLL